MSEFWSRDKFMRVAGEDGNYQEIDIKPAQIKMTKTDREGKPVGEPSTLTNRLREGEYDFVIDVTQPTVTQRMHNQMIATQLFQMIPRPELAPLLIDMLDFPQKDKWKQALGQAAEAMAEQQASGGQGGPQGGQGGQGGV